MADNVAATTQAKKERPWWLRQRRFVVPEILLSKLQGVPEVVQTVFCYIVSKVIVETKKHPRQFTPISSRYFKEFIGSDYADYLSILESDWRVIEIGDAYSRGAPMLESYRSNQKFLREIFG